jgi:septal ring factor EnvC (AmiA/AmiB activator)
MIDAFTTMEDVNWSLEEKNSDTVIDEIRSDCARRIQSVLDDLSQIRHQFEEIKVELDSSREKLGEKASQLYKEQILVKKTKVPVFS